MPGASNSDRIPPTKAIHHPSRHSSPSSRPRLPPLSTGVTAFWPLQNTPLFPRPFVVIVFDPPGPSHYNYDTLLPSRQSQLTGDAEEALVSIAVYTDDIRMSFGQPSQFGVLNNSQSAPSGAFSRSNSIAVPAGPAEVLLGDEVQESESDVIGYVALAGESKVKVFDGQYPENDLPIPSSHLLSISQKRQLFAAGGPQGRSPILRPVFAKIFSDKEYPLGVIVARTSTLRAAFQNKSTANANVLPFQPECTIPMSIRLSHVAFTSDGNYLLLGAQLGGIAIYSVDDILSKGNAVQPQSQVTTGPLLEMKPIPTVAGAEKVCILVGSAWGQGGAVGILDVKTQQVQGNLKTGVTSICWSPKGKQIICGGSEGGLAWIKPDGTEADVVPGVPNYPNHFVSSIFWIESEIIFVIVTPKPKPGPQGHDNESVHFVLIREGKKHTFYRVNDMSAPFGMASRPTYHSFIHLKAWAPNLKDCLVISNTCSTDIGTILRLSNTPFTPTSILSDGRRATLPLTASGGDMTPIGLAVDLTATDTERVDNPYPNVERSATALPCMWILTNEGIISAYWVVYSDAIKIENSSAAYPELLAYEGQQPPQTPQRSTAGGFGQPGFGGQASATSFASQTSAFGTPKPTFGQPSTPTSTFGQPSKPSVFGQPSTSAFGQPSQPTSTFGQASTTTSGFGQPSNAVFGQPSKPASAFGQASTLQPVFGQSTAPQSTFGQSSTSQPAFGQPSAPQSTFGQPAFGSASNLGRPGMSTGAFGSASSGNTGSAFGSGSAFGGQPGASAFSQSSATPAFGTPSALGSSAPAFGSSTALGANRPTFGQPAFGSSQSSGSGFGQASQLGSKLSAFGSGTAAPGGGGGFAKFSGGGGFLATGSNSNAPPAFLQSSGQSNPFAQSQTDSFSNLKSNTSTSGFAMTSAFGSTTTADANKPPGAAAPTAGAFGSAFGNSLGTALSQPAASANIKDDEMQDSDDEVEQPRPGVRGGNMFDVSSALAGNSSNTPAKDPQKALAPAFGQPAQTDQPSTELPKPSAFGTGLFGSAVNKEQPKGAFSSSTKPAALAPAFGTQETKPAAPVSAFGSSTSPEKPSAQVGGGLFGSALQRTASGAQPVSAFGAGSPSASAFKKPSAQPSAFAAGASSTSKSTVSAFGQKPVTPAASPEKPTAKVEVGVAAGKDLPDDSSDIETAHSPAEEEAPLPPDFTAPTKKSAPVADDAPLPPDFAPAKPTPASPVAEKSSSPGSVLSKATGKTALSNLINLPESPEKAAPSNTLPSPAGSPSKGGASGDLLLSPSHKAAGTKATNPLAARKGGVRSALDGLKTSGRLPAQKAGTAAKHGKHLDRDYADENSGFSFMPKIDKNTPSLNKGGSVFDNIGGSSSKPIDFSAASTLLPPDDSDDDSDDVTDDDSNADSEDLSGEGSPVDEGRVATGPSDRSSELGDESWVKTGDTGDEESPVQTSLPPLDTKKASLFERVGSPSKAAAMETSKQKPSKSVTPVPVEPSKLSTKSTQQKAPPSPRALARQKQEEEDKRKADDERRRVEHEQDLIRREGRSKEQILAQAEAQLEILKRKVVRENVEINLNEEKMRRIEDTRRESLQKPFEPSPVLKQLIPYREDGPLTHLKGFDGIMEHHVVVTERRIDNYGLNMRNLESFIKYHQKSDHFTLDDERPVEEIRMTAAPDLSLMAKDLVEKAQELNKTVDLDALRASVMSLISDVDYLCARATDIPNIILLHTHPELRAHIRKRPLAAQQRMQQSNLRRKVPLLRRKFKRAEDEFRILQAHVAAINKNQKANYGDVRPPTVQQVRETVARLTEVAKEKAERLDGLEDTLRKLRIRSVSPAMSRGTTPSFRASSVSFSAGGGRGDRERGSISSAFGWKSTRGRDTTLATPQRSMPGPDKLDYYENTVDSPVSRSTAHKASRKLPKNVPGMFGLIEELGDDEYFNESAATATSNVPIGTSYDRGMAERRKEILTTPKKGDSRAEVPNTPASRQVNRLLKDELEEITGGKGARQAWIDADDYAEDKKLRKEVGRRMAKVIRHVGVKTTRVDLV
ncbi:hypothetical protein Dda_3699 [Drechslerella dactyloides]|uniref:Nucleoporin Nup159/Nup146 N-terminal domain-containing protein n=1 Tax=Drechslerella dactyloides TaxID=74499 RepID=A0AAD6IZY5_DREDA|nr:hypothetical protein Dda_3699 [Drechslerella dactyloides]